MIHRFYAVLVFVLATGLSLSAFLDTAAAETGAQKKGSGTRTLLEAPADPAPAALPEKPLSQKPEDGTQTPAAERPAAVITSPATPAPLSSEALLNALPPKLRQELLDEAEKYYNTCTQSGNFSNYHDCRCLAVKYLDKRLELGPEVDEYTLTSKIQSECPNKPGIAGFSYQKCKQLFIYSRVANLEEFCVCFANKVADLYAQNPYPHLNYQSEVDLQAMQACKFGQGLPPYRPE